MGFLGQLNLITSQSRELGRWLSDLGLLRLTNLVHRAPLLDFHLLLLE